jgi:insertion element IS1 protein InsB
MGSGEPIDVEIQNALLPELEDETDAEMDEMWSYYHDKKHQIWLWWAICHVTGVPLAYTFGTREHKYLDELRELLKPFNIGTVYADNNWAYHKKIPADNLIAGKRNTQQIERHHLTLRTRLKRLCRKTICFSKNKEIHIAVVGTSINTFFFGRNIDVSTCL